MKERRTNIDLLVANKKCSLSGHKILVGAKTKDLQVVEVAMCKCFPRPQTWFDGRTKLRPLASTANPK